MAQNKQSSHKVHFEKQSPHSALIDIRTMLVRLEFEIKLETLLLYSPTATAATAANPTPPLC